MAGGTETTDERTLGRKALDGAKYVGKNFWKVLPVGSLINFASDLSNKKTNLVNILKLTGHMAYATAVCGGLSLYLTGASETGFLGY